MQKHSGWTTPLPNSGTTMEEERKADGAGRSRWSMAVEMLTRPYPLSTRVVVPAVALMLLVPFYLVIADVIAGIFLAYMAYVVFLRDCACGTIPELDRRVAPVLMLALIGIYGFVVVGFWVFFTAQAR